MSTKCFSCGKEYLINSCQFFSPHDIFAIKLVFVLDWNKLFVGSGEPQKWKYHKQRRNIKSVQCRVKHNLFLWRYIWEITYDTKVSAVYLLHLVTLSELLTLISLWQPQPYHLCCNVTGLANNWMLCCYVHHQICQLI